MPSVSFYGVSTTRIFCRFGCPSRPPKPENVRYFGNVGEAIQRGFRPCKRCRPDQEHSPTDAFSEFICSQLVALAGTNPTVRIEDYASQLSLSKRQLERIIKKATGHSPRAFIHHAVRVRQ